MYILPDSVKGLMLLHVMCVCAYTPLLIIITGIKMASSVTLNKGLVEKKRTDLWAHFKYFSTKRKTLM